MQGRSRRRSPRAARLTAVLALAAFAAAACGDGTSASPAESGADGGKNALQIAAGVFSKDVCTPKDQSAVADIKGSVSGFTGYDSEPGDWLTEPATSPLKGKNVDWTSMGLGQPFFLAIQGHWKSFAAKYGFDLKTFDGKFDPSGVQKAVDDITIDKPDAVAFAPLDSDASVPQIEKMRGTGANLVTYNVQPREQLAPRVFADDYTGSQIVGCNAGAYWNARFPGKQAVIGIVDLPQLPQVQDRKNGFLKGFLSQVPTAKIAASVNGGGVLDKAVPAATDMLQGHPDINVVFGINNDSALGTVQALKAAGNYGPDWGVLASVDGSAPAMKELGNPNSPWKAESGYPPYDFSVAALNLLGATLEGKTSKNTQVVLGYPPIKPSPEAIAEWLKVQYPEGE